VIRYDISRTELERRVDVQKAGWRDRAAARTETFRLRKSYDASESPIWSEIKQVFIDLQERKCAFCERPLESKKEYDVEHFRPKGSVKPWKASAALTGAGVAIRQTAAKEPGYHLLPYHLLNYAAACAKCNSELKSDYFPIRGVRQPTGEDPAKLRRAEQAWLIFPLGKIDENPENLITFRGFSPQAAKRPGTFAHRRALVTIEFFKLDDRNKRRELFRGRADVIRELGLALRVRDAANTPPAMLERCRLIIDYHQTPAAPHASCGRSYVKLWGTNPQQAEQLWNDAVDFLATISPIRRGPP
jgi:hypothetical protein